MADISRFFFWRHLRSEASSHIVHFGSGKTKRSGKGLSFWFLPLSSSVAELPMEDRELPFLIRGRSVDFQEVTVQGTLTWRVEKPEVLAQRIDFSIDLRSGKWGKQPLEKITQMLTEQAQQWIWESLSSLSLREILSNGIVPIRSRLLDGFQLDEGLGEMGLIVTSVCLSALQPSAEMEKALQMPTREAIQQESDKATFERRALAVERERAIAENELQNRIELAIRQEELIRQEGANEQRRIQQEVESDRLRVEAQAEHQRIQTTAQAEGIRVVAAANMESERERIGMYRDLPTGVLVGLTAREFVGELPDIGHLTISPDALGAMLTRLADAGVQRLSEEV